MVKVQYQEEELLVVAGDGPSLSRDWLAKLKLEWKHIFNVQAQESDMTQLGRVEQNQGSQGKAPY